MKKFLKFITLITWGIVALIFLSAILIIFLPFLSSVLITITLILTGMGIFSLILRCILGLWFIANMKDKKLTDNDKNFSIKQAKDKSNN